MKTIPTLREKKRYLAFEVLSEKTISRQDLVREILNSMISIYGDKGATEINPSLMSFDGKSGILRCERKKELKPERVWHASITYMEFASQFLSLEFPELSKVQRKSLYNKHS